MRVSITFLFSFFSNASDVSVSVMAFPVFLILVGAASLTASMQLYCHALCTISLHVAIYFALCFFFFFFRLKPHKIWETFG